MSLQEDFLDSFFSGTRSFFLTGGNAINLYYFNHRMSEDFDCFATDRMEYERVTSIIGLCCAAIGATYIARQNFPDFKRFLITRNTENILVDCVNERVPQLYPDKRTFGKVRVDVPEEMIANKLCALLGRAEYKDLVDLYFFQKNGFDLFKSMDDAAKKDGGLTGATLAYVLDQIDLSRMPEALKKAAPLHELENFRISLRDRLLKESFPIK